MTREQANAIAEKLVERYAVPNKIEQIKQQLEQSEEQINQLVYELYALTPKEVKVIEGGVNE